MATKPTKTAKSTTLNSKNGSLTKKSTSNGTYTTKDSANKADKALTQAWKLISKRKKD